MSSYRIGSLFVPLIYTILCCLDSSFSHEENVLPLHFGWTRKEKNGKPLKRGILTQHAYIHLKSYIWLSLLLNCVIAYSYLFVEDNHHHSSNALEQLLGLCFCHRLKTQYTQSTTNNIVWLVEKWRSAQRNCLSPEPTYGMRKEKNNHSHTLTSSLTGMGVGVLSHDDDRVTRGLYLQIDTISIEL